MNQDPTNLPLRDNHPSSSKIDSRSQTHGLSRDDPTSHNVPQQGTRSIDQHGYVASSRVVVLAWCYWLLGSWIIVLWAGPRLPIANAMMIASVAGMMLMWPALRLSQDTPVRAGNFTPLNPGLSVFLDWLCLVFVYQAVLWPLKMLSGWTVSQTFWLGLAVAGWGGLTGALVAWGCCSASGVRRAAAMLLCTLLLFGEPAIIALLNKDRPVEEAVAWTMWVSPIETVWSLVSSSPTTWPGDNPWVMRTAGAVLAAAMGWVWIAISTRSKDTQMRINPTA